MKTARRQELRTNELSHQIEQVGDKLKRNWPASTVALGVALVVIIGVYWYLNHQNTRVMEGWAKLSAGLKEVDTSVSEQIDDYTQVAKENITPSLTAAAWLRVGDTAMDKLVRPKSPEDGAIKNEATPAELTQIARDAFTKVATEFSGEATAAGHALMSLGVLSENQGDFAKATEYYKKLIDDGRFKNLPLRQEAQFRLAQLDTWSKPIQFVAAPPPVVGPTTPPMGDLGTAQPAAKTEPVNATATAQPRPAPTTQPASGN